MEVHVQNGDWLVGKTLGESGLLEEGVTVLGIYRDDGDYIGVPRSKTKIYSDETLVLYGRGEALRDLDLRRADITGEQAHQSAIETQEQHEADQDRREREHDSRRRSET